MNIRIKKKISLIISILLMCGLCGCKYNTPSTVHSYDGYYFNTYVNVRLYGCGSDEIARQAVEMCEYYELIFSRTLEESLLYQLNKEGRISVNTNETKILAEVIAEGQSYYEFTEGSLNIAIEPLSSLWNFSGGNFKVPDTIYIEETLKNIDCSVIEVTDEEINLNGTRVDLGAVAKGYVSDRIKEYLISEGVTSAIINLGGNILCIGNKVSGEDFVIGIQKPFSDETLLGLNIDDMAVVTSGTYERYFEKEGVMYHHILDSKTGMPCENGLLSVTIIAESGMVSDCLSTGCFVMGMEKATSFIEKMDGVYAIFVDEDYNIHYTKGAEKFVK